MFDDYEFTPKLGKIGSRGSKNGRKFLHQVIAASKLSRGGDGRVRKSRFTGSLIGRGAGVGHVLANRDRHAAFRQRRVIVNVRFVRLAGRGMERARVHLRYIQRNGVTRDGQPGQLYGAEQDRADGRAFLGRSNGDRHQFRFIVSAEDGAQYTDLKPLTRRLMTRIEEDLNTSLDWVAIDHYNTGHPHTHILVRGRDDRGKDLIIARNYITAGMRERAAEIVSLDFGPRSDLEIADRLRHEVEQERLTSIDCSLIREMDDQGFVTAADRDAFQQTLRAGRLQKLRRLGLAEEFRAGQWALEADMEDTLRRMGERGDMIETLHRALSSKSIARSPIDHAIFDPTGATTEPVVGRVVARGLSDEQSDRHYLIIDGVDGRAYYIDIGRGDTTGATPDHSIVRVVPKRCEPRQVDRTVAEVATANNGRYNVDLHLKYDPRATQEYAETHIRRLEAIRRAMGSIIREPSGTWIIEPDHLDRVIEYQHHQARAAPVVVERLCHLSLDQQVDADSPTWLDRQLVSDHRQPIRDSGFGREFRAAQARRQQWLLAEGLAREMDDCVVYRANMMAILRQRELTKVARQLSSELCLSYVETRPGEAIEGTLRRSVELASGKYALIERSREFTLVPWRPILERHIDRHVAGTMRGDGISWTIGRQRVGPSIS